MVSSSQQKLLIFKINFLFWKDVGCIKKLPKYRALKSTEHFCISFIQPPLILTSCIWLQGYSVAQSCLTLCTSWTAAYQAPLSRQEYWSGLLFPTLGGLPDPGIELASLVTPALAGRFFTTVPPGKPYEITYVRTKTSTWAFIIHLLLTKLQTLYRTCFSTSGLLRPRSQSRLLCCIYSPYLFGLLLAVSFFSLPSCFTALIILKSAGQGFCWKLIWAHRISSPWLDWGYPVWEEDGRAGVPSTSFHTRGPWCPHDITEDVNFDHLGKGLSAKFIHSQIIISTFPCSLICKQITKPSPHSWGGNSPPEWKFLRSS